MYEIIHSRYSIQSPNHYYIYYNLIFISSLHLFFIYIYFFRHNLHHFDQMFIHAREHINAGTFNTYKNHITKQCDLLKELPKYRYKGSMNTPEKTNVHINKKKKVDVNSN